MSDVANDLWTWSQMVEAVRALDAVVDNVPPEEDEIAERLLREADALRFTIESRVLAPLGVTPRPPVG